MIALNLLRVSVCSTHKFLQLNESGKQYGSCGVMMLRSLHTGSKTVAGYADHSAASAEVTGF